MPARIALIRSPIFQQHETGLHVENAERLAAIDGVLAELAWLHDPELVVEMEPHAAAVADVTRVHRREYIRWLHDVAAYGGGMLDADTLISEHSYEVALTAAGAAMQAVDAVLDGTAERSFALVRPPGHHARPSTAMGFCLINNVAVAARYAIDVRGLERIAIIDFDVHHGNGTQEMLGGDPRILFCSLHQSPAYPFTGAAEETGVAGNVLNIPLPAYTGDAGYAAAFETLVVPKARAFKPQLILASAGYDAHWTNRRYVQGIAMQLTVRGFARIVEELRNLADSICQGRLALVLEGGYDRDALAAAVVATLEILAGKSSADINDPLGIGPATRPPADIGPLLERIRTLHHL